MTHATNILPQLDYAYNALEPYIDEQTMHTHHDKHHQAYLDKYVAAVKGTKFEGMAAEEVIRTIASVPEEIRSPIKNNGGGFVNHAFFWKILAPAKADKPDAKLLAAIDKAFGGFDKFKEAFSNAALNRFGSGWAWLVNGPQGLEIISTANQDSPLSEGKTPLLTIDIWEHAYYLKYQNRRAEYIQAFWNVINWEEVGRRFHR